MMRPGRRRDRLGGLCDVYFPIYCLLMGAVLSVQHRWHVEHATETTAAPSLIRSVNGSLSASASSSRGGCGMAQGQSPYWVTPSACRPYMRRSSC